MVNESTYRAMVGNIILHKSHFLNSFLINEKYRFVLIYSDQIMQLSRIIGRYFESLDLVYLLF